MLGDGENLSIESAPKETFKVNGLKVYLIWRANEFEEDHGKNITKYRKDVEKKILEVTREMDQLKVLGSVAFVVERNESDKRAYVNPKEGKVVHLTAQFIAISLGSITKQDRLTGKEKENDFKKTIRHELVHLFDGYKEDYIERKEKHIDQLKDIKQREIQEMEKMGKEIEKEKAIYFYHLRSFLTAFLHRVRAEGLAWYYEKVKQIESNEHNFFGESEEEIFDKLYSEANKAIEPSNLYNESEGPTTVAKVLEEMAETDEMEEIESLKHRIEKDLLGSDTPYKIGLHIIYSLLYFYNSDPFDSKLPVEKIAELGPFEMITEYEEEMLKNGKKPIITVKSGKGKIDYNNIIKNLAKSFNQTVDVKKE